MPSIFSPVVTCIRNRFLASTVGISTDQPVAALTFDDGPHLNYTPQILDILAMYHVSATFFMLGKAAAASPLLVARVANAGHAIGTHSWDHASFPELTASQQCRQLRAAHQALRPYGVKLFRPPYGDQNLRSACQAKWLGYEIVLWSVDAQDWWCRDPSHILGRLYQSLRPGGILLFHDDQPHTVRTLDLFLDSARGFQFVTLPDLFGYGKREQSAWSQGAADRRQPRYLQTLCGECAVMRRSA